MRKRHSALLRSSSISLAAVILMASQAYTGSDPGVAQRAKKQGREEAQKNALRRVNVVELRSIDQLKVAFQRDLGKVRLVTLLSPT